MSTKGGTSARLVGALSFVFFMSGFASLLYRVAWQRLLTLHYVVHAISNVLIVRVYTGARLRRAWESTGRRP